MTVEVDRDLEWCETLWTKMVKLPLFFKVIIAVSKRLNAKLLTNNPVANSALHYLIISVNQGCSVITSVNHRCLAIVFDESQVLTERPANEPPSERLRPDAVIDYLHRFPSAVITYLEYLIFQRKLEVWTKSMLHCSWLPCITELTWCFEPSQGTEHFNIMLSVACRGWSSYRQAEVGGIGRVVAFLTMLSGTVSFVQQLTAAFVVVWKIWW